jgi:hypothetical protein
MDLEEYFKDAKAYIWEETFAICKSKKVLKGAFVNIIDKDEITVIVDESKIDKGDIEEIEGNYKLMTLNIVFPHSVTGVTAKIASCLAKKGIAIMPIASYSRDHFLIKSDKIQDAKKALQKIGINF